MTPAIRVACGLNLGPPQQVAPFSIRPENLCCAQSGVSTSAPAL
eukprot:CAMPEP_0114045262 /NCGR_PEP_ID=MMETSP1339-20121228/7985_1 /TAXON_ID=94617 /ORGANISM="Fibrocapsa japonica" /LENGTH=43 /assembly_acc=CAM_ASM_000762